jgi:hypothetical protein
VLLLFVSPLLFFDFLLGYAPGRVHNPLSFFHFFQKTQTFIHFLVLLNLPLKVYTRSAMQPLSLLYAAVLFALSLNFTIAVPLLRRSANSNEFVSLPLERYDHESYDHDGAKIHPLIVSSLFFGSCFFVQLITLQCYKNSNSNNRSTGLFVAWRV